MHALIEERRAALEQLCERFHVRRLELFGSAARDDFDPATSDVDFLVEFQPGTPGDSFGGYLRLKEALEALYGRPVDLVELGAVRNPYFLKGIRQPGGATMQDRVRGYLHDVRQGCERLVQFTAGKTLADYEKDVLLRSAVERQFEIIGEALSQLLKLDPGLAPVISNAKHAIAFRNLLIHGYATVDNARVWEILRNKLPTLRVEVEKLLSEEEQPAS